MIGLHSDYASMVNGASVMLFTSVRDGVLN